jgi:hypothetical protein
MKKIIFAFFLLFFNINVFASTNLHSLLEIYKSISPDYLVNDNTGDVYQSDNMQCKAQAFLAAWIVAGKQQSISYNDAKSFITAYSMNNPAALELTRQLYKEDFAKHFSIKGAYSGYGADCDAENAQGNN